MEFKQVVLYGGAILLHIPKDFDDISKIRDVPDNQEVFVDNNSECSIIIELLDETNNNDNHPAEYYFNDISKCNGSEITEILVSDPLVNMSDNFSFSKCFGTQLLEKKYNGIQEKEELELHVLVIRILSKKTDIVISFNNPRKMNQVGEKTGYCRTKIEETLNKMLETLEIVDYNLFI
ncbi:hypothetical protein RS030_81313 [Cryptosporidium xiaoi]|uniref:Mog1p/PsbP-like protein n=1 Tax=Cryptosporidium xiaoi TaxID=659607 RepID=A0AAV9XTQ1_9CRYT